jgi:hypothetical protein
MTTLKNIFAMQLRLNLEAKNGRRYPILKSKNWFLTFYIIKWTRKTLPEIAVPKSLVPTAYVVGRAGNSNRNEPEIENILRLAGKNVRFFCCL